MTVQLKHIQPAVYREWAPGIYELTAELRTEWVTDGRGRQLLLLPGWRWNGASQIVDTKRTLTYSAVHDWLYTTHRVPRDEADALWAAMQADHTVVVGERLVLRASGYRAWYASSDFERAQARLFGRFVI